MSLKLITIDFWNTLFDSTNGEQRNIYRLKALVEQIDRFGIKVKSDELAEVLKASWKNFNEIWKNEQRTPGSIEAVEFLWRYLNVQFDNKAIEYVAENFENSILYYPPALLPGVKSALPLLAQNYRLAIVSDTGFSPGKYLKELLKKNSIITYFDAFSFSDETGVAKPNPVAFLKVLDELNCKPKETIHIGDIEETDIVGAKKLGMKAIRFSGDPTAFLSADSPQKTIADATVDSWDKIPQVVSMLSLE